MTTKETVNVEITCDLCNKQIDIEGIYVNAQSYGADFHISCAGPHKDVLKALHLGNIKIMKYQQWETAEKYIHH